MAKPPKEHLCKRILIVEGYSDLLFCAEFLAHLGKLEGVYIKEFKGKSNVLKRETLEDYLSQQRLAEMESIGILVDADENPSGTSCSLKDSLQAITGRSLSEGVWNEGVPKLGFFVAPDGVNRGEIETLVWNIWSGNPGHETGKDSVLKHLEAMETANAEWKAKSPDKARIGAFLAAAYDEDPRLGAGAREKLFDFNDPGFDRLREFLMGL